MGTSLGGRAGLTARALAGGASFVFWGPALLVQAASADERDAVSTIIVTATKRAEDLQSVPSSVWVAPQDVLIRTQVRDFDDLARIAPSLTITKTTQPANNSINIRGVGTYAFSIAARPSVSVVVDDVPQTFQAQAFKALTDVSQVEILRGPQSTLFGTSATAGVITITTPDPTRTPSAAARVLVTDDHEQRMTGFVSGPLSDTIAARLVFGVSDYRGNLYNTFNGSWVGGHESVNLRAKVAWEAGTNWTVTASAFWHDTETACCTWAYYAVSPDVTFGRFGGVEIPQGDILAGIEPGPDNRLISADVNPRGDETDVGGGLKLERRLGAFTLLSITGYDEYELFDLQDTDGTAFNWGPGGADVPGAEEGGSANGGWFDVDALTQELRLVSPGDERFRYVVGAYYSRMRVARSFVRGSNTLEPYGTLSRVPPTSSSYATYLARAEDTNYALYGQSSFDLTDRLSIVTGLRLNREDVRYNLDDRLNDIQFGVPDCSTTTPSGLLATTCSRFDSVTGRVALEHFLSPSVMVFVSYDRGYKGAAYDLTSTFTSRSLVTSAGPYEGFPIADAVAADQPIAPETVDSFQVGLKSQLSDRVSLNVTAFNAVFHDFQAQSRDELTKQNTLNSVGQVTTRGVEIEMAAQLTPGLSIAANSAYNIAEIDDFPNASCFARQTEELGCVDGQQDLSGAPLPNAPKWTLAANGKYSFPLTNGFGGFATASWHWRSDAIHHLLQDPNSFQDSYGILNVGVGVETDRWSLSVFAVNALDESFALTRSRDGNWNTNPYAPSAGPITDATKWTPARDSARYVGLELSVSY